MSGGATCMRLKLADKRKERGMTINELAEEAGLRRSTISRIENGESNPTLETLYKITTALGITIDELLPDDRETE